MHLHAVRITVYLHVLVDGWQRFVQNVHANRCAKNEQILSNFQTAFRFQLFKFSNHLLNNSFTKHSFDGENSNSQDHFELRFQMNIHDDCVFHLNIIFKMSWHSFRFHSYYPPRFLCFSMAICLLMFSKFTNKNFGTASFQRFILMYIQQLFFFFFWPNQTLYSQMILLWKLNIQFQNISWKKDFIWVLDCSYICMRFFKTRLGGGRRRNSKAIEKFHGMMQLMQISFLICWVYKLSEAVSFSFVYFTSVHIL